MAMVLKSRITFYSILFYSILFRGTFRSGEYFFGSILAGEIQSSVLFPVHTQAWLKKKNFICSILSGHLIPVGRCISSQSAPTAAMDQQAAATRIQTAHRGQQGRKQANQVRREQQLDLEEEAATRIQAVQRGRNVRTQDTKPVFHPTREYDGDDVLAVTRIQAMQRGRIGRLDTEQLRQEMDAELEHEAAAAIQLSWREHSHRSARSSTVSHSAEQHAAAGMIQKTYRGHSGRAEYEMIKHAYDAAVEEMEAATRIQNVQRGRMARAKVAKLRGEMDFIQNAAMDALDRDAADDEARDLIQSMAQGAVDDDEARDLIQSMTNGALDCDSASDEALDLIQLATADALKRDSAMDYLRATAQADHALGRSGSSCA
jgi:hypothetical protein